MAQRLLLKIWNFFSPPSFSSVEPYGKWEEKRCSRGAGYLHIYSSGFISLPADSAAWEHQMVGRICLLFSATGFSEPEVLRSQRLLQVHGEITLSLRPEKIHLKGCGTSGICRMSWSRSYHVYHKAETLSAVGVCPLTFGRIWMSDLILDLPFLWTSSPPFTPLLHILQPKLINLISYILHFICNVFFAYLWEWTYAPCKCVPE